ncbi:MAG: hypothetical protein K0Q73_7786 [Paenibacillus sp.]|jgi:hypothetical protein|nr:hypothetical protein [Paenibacillus sp.]
MNQEVTDFIEGLKDTWQGEQSNNLREVVHQAIPDVQERIQYKKPHFFEKRKIRCCHLDVERRGQLYDL